MVNTLHGSTSDEKKIAIMSFCEAENDDTCQKQIDIDADNEWW